MPRVARPDLCAVTLLLPEADLIKAAKIAKQRCEQDALNATTRADVLRAAVAKGLSLLEEDG